MRFRGLLIFVAVLWATPALAQTTIFNAGGALNSSNTGNGGYSIRQEIATTSENSLGKISVQITSPAAGGLQVDHVSYCIANTAPNCTATPVELTFTGQGSSGGHGFSIGANSTATSDFVSFAAAGTDVIVIMDVTAATTGDFTFGGAVTGAGVPYFHASSASYNQQTVSGYTAGTSLEDYGVLIIQTESASSVVCTLPSMGAGKC